MNVEFIFQLGNLAIEPARSEGIAHACGGTKQAFYKNSQKGQSS